MLQSTFSEFSGTLGLFSHVQSCEMTGSYVPRCSVVSRNTTSCFAAGSGLSVAYAHFLPFL